MTVKTKRILVETETHEIVTVQTWRQFGRRGYCRQCGAEVRMLSVDDAVSVTGVGAMELVRRIGNGAVHSVETGSGHLLFCQSSLEKLSNTITNLNGEK